jgi:hypothetical protein
MGRFLTEIDRACEGRRWWPRAPAVLFFAYVWLRHARDPLYHSVFGALNLGVHELGHIVFAPFGDVVGALGGSLLQCLVPVIGMTMFARQCDVFAVAFAFGWLATNLFEVATYAGDAVTMELPLVTPGGGPPIHDWNYVLGAIGWLGHSGAIAGAIRAGAHLGMTICLGGMVWLLLKMARAARRGPAPAREMPKGGGLAARPRETSLRPWREPDPPWISAPLARSSRPSRPTRQDGGPTSSSPS